MRWKQKREQCIIDMQVDLTIDLMKHWNITPEEFVELDKRYKINEFIREQYEVLHLIGTPGIIIEIEQRIERLKNGS